MTKTTLHLPLTLTLAIVMLYVMGCSSTGPASVSKKHPTQYTSQQHAVTKMSGSGNYRFALYSDEAPLPLGKIHSWTLHVESKSGVALENADIKVTGWMPAHGHGFPTQPRVTEYLGNGDYKVDGIKFSMTGHWNLIFEVQNEKVVFDVYM